MSSALRFVSLQPNSLTVSPHHADNTDQADQPGLAAPYPIPMPRVPTAALAPQPPAPLSRASLAARANACVQTSGAGLVQTSVVPTLVQAARRGLFTTLWKIPNPEDKTTLTAVRNAITSLYPGVAMSEYAACSGGCDYGCSCTRTTHLKIDWSRAPDNCELAAAAWQHHDASVDALIVGKANAGEFRALWPLPASVLDGGAADPLCAHLRQRIEGVSVSLYVGCSGGCDYGCKCTRPTHLEIAWG